MPNLHIRGRNFPLRYWQLEGLLARGVVYPCDEGGWIGEGEFADHGYHITPDHKFTLDDVEQLMLSVEQNVNTWK